MEMKVLLSAKTVIGLVSSAAITGSLYVGLDHATSNLPAHWYIEGTPASPVEVQLLSEQMSGYSCDWVASGSREHLAKCPQVTVTARRTEARKSETTWPSAVSAPAGHQIGAVAQESAGTRSAPEKH
jgi:hypothetical protein